MNLILKKNLFLLYLLSLVLFFSIENFSQVDSSEIIIEDNVDDLLPDLDIETDNSELFNQIEELYSSKIDLNSDDLETLQSIPAIDLNTVNLIFNHRKKFGDFFSINELYSVQGLAKEQADKIIPFVTVTQDKNDYNQIEFDEASELPFIKNINLNYRSRVQNDLQDRAGFIDGDYAGSSYKIYNRFIFKAYDNYQAGFISEKDAGEKSFNDFTSFHFAVRDLSLIKVFVAGDYNIEFGQGLVLWSPYGFSKSADAIYPVKKKSRDIIPYTSTDENKFFRGAALSVTFSDFTLSGYFSKNKFDANTDSLTSEILSVSETGLHRTQSEIENRKAVEETFIGGRVDYNSQEWIKAGLLFFNSKFSNHFIAEKPFDLDGNNFSYNSAYYNIYLEKINLFGEWAYDGKAVASLNGLELPISSSFSYVALIRNYPSGFSNLHGFGFGEQSGSTKNEFGIYNGFRWKSFVGTLNFYYDQFKFPGATFNSPLPTSGDEILVDLDTKPLKGIQAKFRFKLENKEVTESINFEDQIAKRLKQNIRVELIYDISKSLRIKSRFELADYSIKDAEINDKGFLFYQEMRYLPIKNLTIYGRVAFFRTDSFNSAIYVYENDLIGVFNNIALFGEGIRWYFLARYKILDYLQLSFKYAETYKPQEDALSSGNSLIVGNIDNKLSIQIDVKF
ncbi:MAG: helix-hairpin-helix domain-containing protein [Ignavibacteriales bacterium]|nr:helix-hairpin-helix domain-containing protein [Ignavibacteriales bacterium]